MPNWIWRAPTWSANTEMCQAIHNWDSKSRKRRSSSHCWEAFSLDFRKEPQAEEGLLLPRGSLEQAETAAAKTSGARHKLSPGKKLCSKLVRTMCLRSR